MVLSGQITVARRNLCNLTREAFFTYTSSGQVMVLTPDRPPTTWSEEDYLVIPRGECSRYLNKGYRLDNLVCYNQGGIGREGDQMTTLTLYSDPTIRIYPTDGE